MASFGESLRRERELRDISLREIADATKINLRYLEALEQNRFDILPGGVFNKGFIRAYARFIGADGETLVDAYLHEITPPDPAAVPAVAGAPGLLRLAEAPKRRAVPTTTPAPAASTVTAAPLPFPAASSPSSPVASPSGGSHSAALPAVRPAADPTPVPTPRPAAPLRVATPPQHHEPLTEHAAALAAITNPHLPGQPVTRRRTRITPGIALAAGGLLLAGGLAVLVSRGLGREDDGAADRATAATVTGASGSDDPATIAAALGPTIGEAIAGPALTATSPEVARPLDGTGSLTGPDGSPATTPPSAGAVDRERPDAATAAATRPRETRADTAQTPVEVPAPPPAAAAEERPRSPALPGMEFRIEATTQVWVQVSCDGEDKVNRMLQAGEGATLRCLSVVRVSVTDGGAVRLMVDGARCVTPAESGYEMKGFMIRAENAAAICPPAAGGFNGRR